MPEVRVRKRLTTVEEIFHEGGPIASTPLRRAAALAVNRGPRGGRGREWGDRPHRLARRRLLSDDFAIV